ncbi:PA2169 family four-helix-bundle protein [Galbibacter sp. BG1]|uniref:ferritin-like domain-containing protein n=1 Tax=Galbibacter sp. BG1 TaxID=1170699 RepID=UPI0015C08F91|nr:PA2169 family four-helix-bundle protein [Galbibacter sp. BG1]QLE02844.1 PA2169 family four-helix-bundle protein [Galbibacter sp. BG1]
MADYTEKIEKRIKALIEKNVDAHKGYSNASDNADHSGLEVYFRDKAAKRLQFITQLRDEATKFGLEIDSDGSFTGDAHRAWMDIKSFFSGDDAEAMLEESIRGDKAAVEEYDEVLEEDLPVSTRMLVLEQRTQIMNDLNEVKTLEDIKD